MPWHKPRFKLVQLILLVAVVAVELAAVPAPHSWIFVGLGLIFALLTSILGPLMKIEWLAIALFHYCVYSQFAEWMNSLRRSR